MDILRRWDIVCTILGTSCTLNVTQGLMYTFWVHFEILVSKEIILPQGELPENIIGFQKPEFAFWHFMNFQISDFLVVNNLKIFM